MKSGDRVVFFNRMKGWAVPTSSFVCFKESSTVNDSWERIGSGRLQNDCEKGHEASIIQGNLPDWLIEKIGE